MKKWKIVTDSGSCIRSLEKSNIDFSVVPLMLMVENKVFVDNDDLNLEELLTLLSTTKDKSSSACPSPETYKSHFEGAENIICFTITSGLSGSYNSAELGKKIALEENPDLNIHIYDTLTAGGEMDLLINKAASLIEENENISLEELVNQVTVYNQNTHVDFLLESVKNLANNGRVSKLVSHMVGLLGIRLVGTRTPEGTIQLAHKSKGPKRGIKAMIDGMIERGYQGGKLEISHGMNEEIAMDFITAIQEKFPNLEYNLRLMSALCTFYAERNGLIVGFETN